MQYGLSIASPSTEAAMSDPYAAWIFDAARLEIDIDRHRREATRSRAAARRAAFLAVWRWARHAFGLEAKPATARWHAGRA